MRKILSITLCMLMILPMVSTSFISFAAEYICEVNGIAYETLDEAIATAETGYAVIKLLTDIVYDNDLDFSTNSNITSFGVNLNNKELIVNGNIITPIVPDAPNFRYMGSLSFSDGTLTVNGDAYGFIYCGNDGIIKIEGDVFGTVSVKGSLANGNITVNGNINGGAYGVYLEAGGTVTVNGDITVTEFDDVNMSAGVCIIYNGIVNVNGNIIAPAGMGVYIKPLVIWPGGSATEPGTAIVTIEGTITADTYIQCGVNMYSEADYYTKSITKAGYNQYGRISDSWNVSTSVVFVKAIEVPAPSFFERIRAFFQMILDFFINLFNW